MSLTRPQRLSVRVVKHLPRVLVSDTERVGLSVAFIAVGLSSLNQTPKTLGHTDIGVINILTWSLSFILGGILTIWGMSIGSRHPHQHLGAGRLRLGRQRPRRPGSAPSWARGWPTGTSGRTGARRRSTTRR